MTKDAAAKLSGKQRAALEILVNHPAQTVVTNGPTYAYALGGRVHRSTAAALVRRGLARYGDRLDDTLHPTPEGRRNLLVPVSEL